MSLPEQEEFPASGSIHQGLEDASNIIVNALKDNFEESLISDKNESSDTLQKDSEINSPKNSSEGSTDESTIHSETNQECEWPEGNVKNESTITEKDIENILGSPYHKIQENVFVEGNMVSYVAPNFNDLLKMERVESPGSSWTQDTSRSLSSESLSSTNSGWSSDLRKPTSQMTSPTKHAPIDATFLTELEKHTHQLSTNLNDFFNTFISHTNQMSHHALQSVNVYKNAVESTCDTVDNSIKSMYALMAKCEELHNSMKPVYHIHSQIKEIKRILDILEMQILSEDVK